MTTTNTIWKTIKLGTGLKTVEDFREALTKKCFRIDDWADDILGKGAFETASEEIEVNLVVVSVAELGFEEGATYGEICDRALKFGLQLCPAETGPQLRLQYPDQSKAEKLLVAMEAIVSSDKNLSIFFLGYFLTDEGWLGADYGLPGRFLDKDDRFIFVTPHHTSV